MRSQVLLPLLLSLAALLIRAHQPPPEPDQPATDPLIAISNPNLKAALEASSEYLDHTKNIPPYFREAGYSYFMVKFLATPFSDEQVRLFARDAGLEPVGPLGELPNHYVFRLRSSHLRRRAAADARVVAADILELHRRAHGIARVTVPAPRPSIRKRGSVATGVDYSNAADPFHASEVDRIVNGTFIDPRIWTPISDPLYASQWHLHNAKYSGADINVTGVWTQGITGYGVNVAIIDDGLDYTSEDLYNNFLLEGSFDFNDHTKLPTPRLPEDYHGTRCAGQVAAVRNNGLCGIGVAYNAKVAGIRILSTQIDESDEIRALNYRFDLNDIYSCSWGPTDDGRTVEGPTPDIAEAFIHGVSKGRGGKGSIFVFATGNGGRFGDNCNFDGYTNSIYTISIGAIDYLEQHPPYSEPCSAQLAVTYSNGNNLQITTTDVGVRKCTSMHGGTSAAAPLAAGIYALVLSVRPDLSWRDVQRLTVENAIPVQRSDSDWEVVALGRIYNHKFGFGKLDAWRLVEAAKSFQNVAPQTSIRLPVVAVRKDLPPVAEKDGHQVGDFVESTVMVTEAQVADAQLKRLEHITVTVNIDSTYRGSLEVFLASPSGVRSQLAAPRRSDGAKEGLKNWTFSSVKHWDESPVGNWTLLVRNTVAGAKGSFKDWQLTLWGENTDAPPEPQRPIMYPEIPPRVARELKSKLGTNVTFPSGSLVAPYAGDGRPLLDQQQGDEELRFTLGQTIGISVFSVAISGILAMLGYIVLRRIIRGQKSGSLWTPLGDKLSGGSGRQGGYDSAADGERGRLRPESFELDEVIVAGPAITSSNSDEYLQIHGEGEQEAQLVKMTAFNKQQQQQPSPSTIDSGGNSRRTQKNEFESPLDPASHPPAGISPSSAGSDRNPASRPPNFVLYDVEDASDDDDDDDDDDPLVASSRQRR